MEKRTQIDCERALVYENEGMYYVCDYIFLDYWGGHLTRKGKPQGSTFKGATGSVLQVLTDSEIRSAAKNYDVDELWKEAVQAGRYTGSLDEYREELESSGDLESLVYEEYAHDVKGRELGHGEHWDVRGGGRCFDATEMRRLYAENPDGFKVYDEALFKAIIAAESGLLDYIAEEIASVKISLDYEKDEKTRTQLQNELRHLEGYQKQRSKRTR